PMISRLVCPNVEANSRSVMCKPCSRAISTQLSRRAWEESTSTPSTSKITARDPEGIGNSCPRAPQGATSDASQACPPEPTPTILPFMALHGSAVNQLEHLDEELETLLTSFDTSYAWRYGNVKEGLRDLYEKAKRDQWNGTTQLKWDTDVDPEHGILP